MALRATPPGAAPQMTDRDPACYLCHGSFGTRATWQFVTLPPRRGTSDVVYRPVCDDHAQGHDQPGRPCEVCGIEVVHLDPGLNVRWVACSFPHLDEARRLRPPPPPEPRPCGQCGTVFRPKRRHGARFCSKPCAQRARRQRERDQVDGLLRAVGVDVAALEEMDRLVAEVAKRRA